VSVLSDEDKEQDPDRWCSHTAWGQEFWQVMSQWVWNLRLQLGHRLHPTPMCTTEFAPAQAVPQPVPVSNKPAAVAYGAPQWARAAQMGGFAGERFLPQPNGTLCCPAGQPLSAQEHRPERDGSVRMVYAARIGHCRVCPLREPCLGYGTATKKPRRVSAVLWPIQGPPLPPAASPTLPPASQPILWGDWSRCQTRRQWMHRLAYTNSDSELPADLFCYQFPSTWPLHATTTGTLPTLVGPTPRPQYLLLAFSTPSSLRNPNRLCCLSGSGKSVNLAGGRSDAWRFGDPAISSCPFHPFTIDFPLFSSLF
jgi:hypothetical protein